MALFHTLFLFALITNPIQAKDLIHIKAHGPKDVIVDGNGWGQFGEKGVISLGYEIKCKTTFFPNTKHKTTQTTCAKINCDFSKKDEYPHCECIKFQIFGFVVEWLATCICKKIISKRRLQLFNVNGANFTMEPPPQPIPAGIQNCLVNGVCAEMLSEYNTGFGGYYDTLSTRSALCDQTSGCTDDVFALFNAAGEDDCPSCSLLNSYEYINDGTKRTYKEAQEYCRSIDSDLATIHDEQELYIALTLIADGPSPWIGLFTLLGERPHHFTYIDCTECVKDCDGWLSYACVCGELWERGKPRNCSDGSKYTRIREDTGKIDNDKSAPLMAALCNCPGSATCPVSAKVAAQIELDDIVDNTHHEAWYKEINMNIIFGGVILFVFINNIIICYWCLYGKNKKYQIIENK